VATELLLRKPLELLVMVPELLMVPELTRKPPGRMVMVPSLVTVTRGSMVRITPEFIVQVSPEPIVISELIIVLVINVIDAA